MNIIVFMIIFSVLYLYLNIIVFLIEIEEFPALVTKLVFVGNRGVELHIFQGMIDLLFIGWAMHY